MPVNPMSVERAFSKQFIRGMPSREYWNLFANRVTPEFSEKKEKRASLLADRVLLRCKLASLNPSELSELSRDLQIQSSVHGPGAVQTVLPGRNVQDVLSTLQQESGKQTLMGLGGGAAGGLVGGAGGALIAAITKGRQHALSGGFLGVLPGAVGGYVAGKRKQQQRELMELLRDKLR